MDKTTNSKDRVNGLVADVSENTVDTVDMTDMTDMTDTTVLYRGAWQPFHYES